MPGSVLLVWYWRGSEAAARNDMVRKIAQNREVNLRGRVMRLCRVTVSSGVEDIPISQPPVGKN